jgi:AcrR family transcriptional regulator
MTAPRRFGTEDSKTRPVLLDAAARLMRDEGYAAVTSRRVAVKAGVKPALVHYYFRTMDDLFLALFRRGAEANLARLRHALASPQPLHALWEINSEPQGAALMIEFMALANHRKAIRAEIAAYSEQFRAAEQEAVARALRRSGVDAEAVSPAAVTVLMASVPRIIVMENTLGFTAGHDEAIALVEGQLRRLEPGPAQPSPDSYPGGLAEAESSS